MQESTKQVIRQLKEVRNEKQLSFQAIIDMMEANGEYISKSTLSRVFSDGSENLNFKYDDTIRPIADALLDINNLEDDDSLDVKTMKTLLRYKMKRIEELEREVADLQSRIDKEKIKSHEKLEKEREQSRRSIDFLKDQINLKDKRIDLLLNAVYTKDEKINELVDKLIQCGNCHK
jgi:transcriptional regulator with XRE-family HTH domain